MNIIQRAQQLQQQIEKSGILDPRRTDAPIFGPIRKYNLDAVPEAERKKSPFYNPVLNASIMPMMMPIQTVNPLGLSQANLGALQAAREAGKLGGKAIPLISKFNALKDPQKVIQIARQILSQPAGSIYEQYKPVIMQQIMKRPELLKLLGL